MRKVFNNKDLIKFIAEYVDDPKDFRNFRLVSKKILEVSRRMSLVKQLVYSHTNVFLGIRFVSRLSGRYHGMETMYRKDGRLYRNNFWNHGSLFCRIETFSSGAVSTFEYKGISFNLFDILNVTDDQMYLWVSITNKTRYWWEFYQYVDGKWIKGN